jgi:hypothetical protein
LQNFRTSAPEIAKISFVLFAVLLCELGTQYVQNKSADSCKMQDFNEYSKKGGGGEKDKKDIVNAKFHGLQGISPVG